jgi:hypothetical protein
LWTRGRYAWTLNQNLLLDPILARDRSNVAIG